MSDNLQKRIDDLERRIADLERRPVYIPVPQWVPPIYQPPYQPHPMPPWTITSGGTTGEAK